MLDEETDRLVPCNVGRRWVALWLLLLFPREKLELSDSTEGDLERSDPSCFSILGPSVVML